MSHNMTCFDCMHRIQLFDGVDVIIFVAALNHYCCVLFEDENINCMMESLELFDEIINSKWFRRSQMVLFLNKEDIFQTRLKEGISLSVCFGDKYDGPNYDKPGEDRKLTNEQEKKEWFDYCYVEGLKFIKNEYRGRNQNKRINNNKVYIHVTNATSKNNVETVFKDVRHSLIQNSLIGSGLLDK